LLVPRKFALPIALLAWLFFAWFMWATLIGVNMGSICGRVIAPWAYLAEGFVFLPTIWLTRPLDAWLDMRNAGMAVTIGSVIEVALLATIYSTILYLLLRRTLLASLGRFFRRFGWIVAAVVVVMIGSSVWLRAQLNAGDYGAPLVHEVGKVVLNVRTPLADPSRTITMTGTRSLPIETSDELSIIARDGATPLTISVKPHYGSDTAEFVLHRLYPDRLESMPSLPVPGKSGTPIGEPRCAYGRAMDVLLAVPGARGRMFYTTSLISPALEQAPVDLDSQQVIVSSDGTYYVGLDGKDLQVVRGSKVLGTMPRFSDHTLNNAAVTRTSDGILHILGTEVLIPHDNSSRVHYLRFDPAQSRWLGDDLLMVRAKFTSTSTPKIARIGESVDAFWHNDGGSNTQPEDGLYARRIGEGETWHLVGERCEFVVLEDADGRGSTLIGAATKPSQSGIVRWFLRRGNAWYDLGSTDAGQKLYTLDNSGTEPFAVWRGEKPGTIHAAFNGIDHIVIEDLQLP